MSTKLIMMVDEANAGTPVFNKFTLSEIDRDRTTYQSDEYHSADAKDVVQLYRTGGKRSGSSRGNDKVTIKFTKEIAVANSEGSGDILLPLIGQVNFSIPRGATTASVIHARQRIISFLDDDELCEKLMDDLNIIVETNQM